VGEAPLTFGDSLSLKPLREKWLTPGLIKRKLLLTHIPSGENLTVTHIQDKRWEDDEAPQTEDLFRDIDYMIKAIKKHRDDKVCEPTENKPPIVVHCSAGLGRTGTLITIYAIMESVERLEASLGELRKMDFSPIEDYFVNLEKSRISVFGAVRKIREQRWNMVKRLCQYSFIYAYLERWIRKTYFERVLFDKDIEPEEDFLVDDEEVENIKREINKNDDL